MLDLNEAQRQIRARLPQLAAETVPLSESNGRILARDVLAGIDLPPADNSSVDGYAVRSSDLALASAERAAGFKVAATVPAGAVSNEALVAGACARVFTGSYLPEGADAVVMQEDTRREGDTAYFSVRVKPWQNVRLRGEDVRSGAKVLAAGLRMQARHLGVLAGTGQTETEVGCRPRVALLATGRELQAPGTALRPGSIYESNRIVLAEAVRAVNGVPLTIPPVADELEAIATSLRQLVEDHDVLITTGGVSVGDHDLIRPAMEALGGTIRFWRVRMRPGKPFLFGEVLGKPLFGLPGNPVSAITSFVYLVRPALLVMQGASDTAGPRACGRLTRAVENRDGRPHFLRVSVGRDGSVCPVGLQGSHAIYGLSQADGWLRVDAGCQLANGQEVTVTLWDC